METELEGPGWYRDFLDSCADAPLTDPASSFYINLPSGKLYNAGLEVCEQLESTVRDLRHPKNDRDRELAIAAGTWPSEWGDEPWFLVFARVIRIRDLDNKPTRIVALAWSPPNELAFITSEGAVAFVMWPNGQSAGDMVQRSSEYGSLAAWFLIALTWRSAWRQGAFEFREITEAEYLADWMPAGGYWVVLSSDEPAVYNTDGETQWGRR